MTGIMILFGRDKIMAMEWTFFFNAGICGVLISRLEGKVAALRIFFFFFGKKRKVSKHWVSVNPPGRPPPFQQLLISQHRQFLSPLFSCLSP